MRLGRRHDLALFLPVETRSSSLGSLNETLQYSPHLHRFCSISPPPLSSTNSTSVSTSPISSLPPSHVASHVAPAPPSQPSQSSTSEQSPVSELPEHVPAPLCFAMVQNKVGAENGGVIDDLSLMRLVALKVSVCVCFSRNFCFGLSPPSHF